MKQENGHKFRPGENFGKKRSYVYKVKRQWNPSATGESANIQPFQMFRKRHPNKRYFNKRHSGHGIDSVKFLKRNAWDPTYHDPGMDYDYEPIEVVEVDPNEFVYN